MVKIIIGAFVSVVAVWGASRLPDATRWVNGPKHPAIPVSYRSLVPKKGENVLSTKGPSDSITQGDVWLKRIR